MSRSRPWVLSTRALHCSGDDRADHGHGCGSPYDKAGRAASRPGFPLQSPLRSDFRCNPSRLRSLRSLRAPLAGQPDTPCRPSGHRAGHPLRSPRAGAPRSARRRPRLARPGRLRRLRASPRLGAAALRASPVPASPRTGLRTAPGTGARTGAVTRADAAAAAFGSVLRTTACGSVRTAVRSRAAAAPLRRLRRLRFPERRCSSLAVPDRPGRPWVSHLTHLRCPLRHGRQWLRWAGQPVDLAYPCALLACRNQCVAVCVAFRMTPMYKRSQCLGTIPVLPNLPSPGWRHPAFTRCVAVCVASRTAQLAPSRSATRSEIAQHSPSSASNRRAHQPCPPPTEQKTNESPTFRGRVPFETRTPTSIEPAATLTQRHLQRPASRRQTAGPAIPTFQRTSTGRRRSARREAGSC